MSDFLDYLEQDHVRRWEKESIIFYIVQVPDMGHYCGYARFPRPLLSEPGYNGIVTYVPVHGGVTLAKLLDDDTMVYGFDCAHAGDEADPRTRDLDWLQQEAENMAEGIQLATLYEYAYLTSLDDNQRADVVEAYHDECLKAGLTFQLQDNFGAMINILFGKV